MGQCRSAMFSLSISELIILSVKNILWGQWYEVSLPTLICASSLDWRLDERTLFHFKVMNFKLVSNEFSSQPLCRLPYQVKPCQVTRVTHTAENIAFINKPTAGGKIIGIGSKCLSSTRLHTSSKPICRSKYISDKFINQFFCYQYTRLLNIHVITS